MSEEEETFRVRRNDIEAVPVEISRIKPQGDRFGLEMASHFRMLPMKAAYDKGPIKEED